MYKVALQECIDKMNLECLTPDINIEEIEITQSDVNRPALHVYGKPGYGVQCGNDGTYYVL